MAIVDWNKNEDGNITASPVVAWDAVIGGMYGMLRIQFVNSHDDLERQEFHAVQIGMSAKQARTLAGDLLQIADKLDAQQWGNRQ